MNEDNTIELPESFILAAMARMHANDLTREARDPYNHIGRFAIPDREFRRDHHARIAILLRQAD